MKVLSENRRAKFDYETLDTYEAGIELLGTEVKSAKLGRINLSGGHAIVRKDGVWLVGIEIPAYQPKNAPQDFDAKRTRRLLLHASEIKNLIGKLHEKGLSLIPLRAYLKNSLVKIELGLARSRKKHDKRELLARRAHEREIRERER
ncbi:MAG: SsrA-binding protein SmpB [Candidatus Liptonbacteria bacterium]|nr:SsrA-binding protein SmpB [Candidatus Liptonbacteria bacterium]